MNRNFAVSARSASVVTGLALLASVLCSGCGGSLPGLSEERDSGQSGLMSETFAGKNKCNPDNHDRPFIIEWDATDMSSFESHAAGDIIVVKYEGCDLKVLDQCKNDSIRGAMGAYKPVEWTSGSLETMEIANEGELSAKLPLGVATLGGRVSAGEQFRMEYYVAGTRNATRDAVYASDLASVPGCEGATHFVYGYNLGAFALGSAKEISGQVSGSAYGFGADASQSKSKKAEKKGGDLATCKSDSAKEIEGCKAPIRLTLRAISKEANPDKTAMSAQDTPESLNAAGQVNQKLEMSEAARAHYEAAAKKMNAKDGKGCLAELDSHDKLDAKHKSTDPASGIAHMRAQCLMIAGQCAAGKTLSRKTFETLHSGTWGPEQIDKAVEGQASMHCQGSDMSERDQLLAAMNQLLVQAATSKKPPEFCLSAYNTIKKLEPKVKPKDDDDSQVIAAKNAYIYAVNCLVKAGDCDAAYKVHKEGSAHLYASMTDPKIKEQTLRTTFESSNAKCKK